jgi:hypothetical protein
MPHKIITESSFARDVKDFKKNKSLLATIKDHVRDIVEDPSIGVVMVKNLAGLRKCRFDHHSSYRIIYRVYDCCNAPGQEIGRICPHPMEEVDDKDCTGLVQFLHVQTRQDADNLYRKRKKDVEKSLLDGFNITE